LGTERNSGEPLFWHHLVKVKLREVGIPDFIFLLDDIIDGAARPTRTVANPKALVTRSLNEQASCALSILRMVPKKKETKIIGFIGSGYHDEQYFNVNEQICDSLGGEFHGTTGILDIAGHSSRLYHGSTQAYIYLEMIMGRRRLFAQEAMRIPQSPGRSQDPNADDS